MSAYKKNHICLLVVILTALSLNLIAVLHVSADKSLTSSVASQLPGGYTTIRGIDNMTEVYIPAGIFTMGTDSGYPDASPSHEVYLDAYWIDQTEVTNAMYLKCVSAGGCGLLGSQQSYTQAKYYGNPDYNDFPVVYANYFRAQEYCKWAGGSLPTEAQWEKAAKGYDNFAWPWGDTFNGNNLNYYYAVGDTTPVGTYPTGASPFGVLDMAGNVFEWVSDWYSQDFYKTPNASIDNPGGPVSGQNKILRGGSWLSGMNATGTTVRKEFAPGASNYDWGFRCVRSFSPDDIQIERYELGPGIALSGEVYTPPQQSPQNYPQQNPVVIIEQNQPAEIPAGFTRIREKDGMTEVYIPAGVFVMGTDSGNAGEGPAHEVYLDAYWIDQTEITNAMYMQCVGAGACGLLGSQQSYARERYYGIQEFFNYPAVYVNAFRADEYCAWIGGSLPTEAQWEKAAKGTEGYTWPWGDTFDGRNLNYYYSVGDTSQVGKYLTGASPYGVLDMAGNVYEWVRDWFGINYYSTPNASMDNPEGPASGQNGILRGGSWLTGMDATRTTARKDFAPGASNYDWGFRCSRSK
jgi:formylglycine-generating enzyme required for sulfatase activity